MQYNYIIQYTISSYPNLPFYFLMTKTERKHVQ